VDIKAAAGFVRRYGSLREKEALRLLFEPGSPRLEVISSILESQNPGGGWGYRGGSLSSVHETLWRLTQAVEVGLDAGQPSIMAAVGFLAQKQNPDGSWAEDPRLALEGPPWVAPGDRAAEVYLTSSAGYVLATLTGTSLGQVSRASRYLAQELGGDGRLPSFLHAHWLAAGLWWRTGEKDLADRALVYLSSRLGPAFPTNNLSWAAVTLLAAGCPPDTPFLEIALDLLEGRQCADGHFDSEDGETAFPHATWEALKALKLSGRLLS
jgi:hypothetical protein